MERFECESPAMEVELLKRGYLPLHEGLPNRNLVPGDKHELEAAHDRGEYESGLKDNEPIEECSSCEGDWPNFDGSYWDAQDDAWATIVPDPNHPRYCGRSSMTCSASRIAVKLKSPAFANGWTS
jgi:hypothetical protein